MDVLWRVYRSITEDRVLLTSAGAAFYLLLALVPSLTAFISIYGLFSYPSTVAEHVAILDGLVPAAVAEVLRDQLSRLALERNETLGFGLVLSLGFALWSASSGIKAMFEAMNVAYHEREKRSFLVVNAIALLFCLGAAIAAVAFISIVVVLPVVLSNLPLGETAELAVRAAAYAVLFIVTMFGIAALYRWGPSRVAAKWRWITPGALFSAVTLGIGSAGLSWYVASFSDGNAAYGSLGTVIGLLTWLWLSITIVTLGAQLNAEVEHQTTRDSTVGPNMPIGERGAFVADTVGDRRSRD